MWFHQLKQQRSPKRYIFIHYVSTDYEDATYILIRKPGVTLLTVLTLSYVPFQELEVLLRATNEFSFFHLQEVLFRVNGFGRFCY